MLILLEKADKVDINTKNILGVALVCLGLLLIAPYIPKFLIFFLGIYFIYIGVRLLDIHR